MKRKLLVFAAVWVGFATQAWATDFPVGAYVSGDVTMQFEKSGSLRVLMKGKTMVDGTYVVSADKITLKDIAGPMACAKDQAGTYKWSVADGKLLLAKIDDPCQDRADDITAQAWARKR